LATSSPSLTGTKTTASSASAGSVEATTRSTRRPLYDNPPEYGVADDETPELTKERVARLTPAKKFFAEHGMRPPPGRPKVETPKVSVHIRLDADIVEHFKRSGSGWQTRLNGALGELVRKGR
jgi:uncharacterized protein (DUF4415 family)